MLDRMCEQREVVSSVGIVDRQLINAQAGMSRATTRATRSLGVTAVLLSIPMDVTMKRLDASRYRRLVGAQFVLDALVKPWPWVKYLLGDAFHDRQALLDNWEYLDCIVAIVCNLKGRKALKRSRAALDRQAYVWGDALRPTRM
jgi:hypothetical protein